MATTTGTWIYEKGSVTGGGGGTGGGGVPAPPVDIIGSADVIFRSDHRVEVAVDWAPAATATAANFLGVAVYLEDPDISSGANHPLDGGSMPLDGTAQVSGEWTHVFVNESVKSPAILFLDSTMGATSGQTYKGGRDIRIYLAAYGPNSHPHPVRATDTVETPTPNLLVYIPKGRGQGESGQEWAFLITDPHVTVNPDFNRLTPKYNLTLTYTPPDPSIPVPPGINHFGGCRIVFVYENDSGDPIFPGSDTGMTIPVAQANTGFKSDDYEPNQAGGKFRVYFCSEDDSQPVGSHINSLVEGTTPFAYAIIPPVQPTPNIKNFTISDQKTVHLLDGSFVAQASFSWNLPTEDEGKIRYSGVYLYLVKATGSVAPLAKFPQALTGQQSSVESLLVVTIPNGLGAVIPNDPETWVIAAISVNNNGVLKEHPEDYGKPGFTSPTVTWDIGPPAPGSPGSGTEHAPLVTLGAGASASAHPSISSDGVGMVSFDVGPWINPDDNRFGTAQIAMVINHDSRRPVFWTVPSNGTSFSTPPMPSFGNVGADVPVDFYIVSDDPQGQKNSLQPGTTPVIQYTYKPAQGAIIPTRSGWFDETQFSWPADGAFTADNILAKNVNVGKTLVVGGAPASFGSSDNGQIAVKNSAGVLRAWLGEQQPDQGQSGPPLWGGWFGQVWIGGTSPLNAPVYVDNQGIVTVGGIAAAAAGLKYPYLSVRDQTGLEMGRIGASLNVPSQFPGDNVGNNPPQITAGAWFTQLAVGGQNLSNWNLLVIPDTDPRNPLGSQFLLRNIRLMQIDYAAHLSTGPGDPANEQYQFLLGNSIWTATDKTSWQFPGMHLHQIDNNRNLFGAVFISRGVVLRGTQDQRTNQGIGYPVLVSLVTFNGQASGSYSPPVFWGELAMYSPQNPFTRTVYLASGSAASGNPTFAMLDYNTGRLLFGVDQNGNTNIAGIVSGQPNPTTGASTPLRAYAYSVGDFPVIDPTGKWVGQPITVVGGQTPWTQNINAAGWSLTGVGNISAAQYMMSASGTVVIDPNGRFTGAGVDVGTFGIGCGGIIVVGTGEIDCGLVWSRSNFVCGSTSPTSLSGAGWVAADNIKCVLNLSANQYLMANGNVVINANGAFIGGGVDVGGQGIACGGLTTRVQAPGIGDINCYGRVYSAGPVYGSAYYLGLGQGGTIIDANGTFYGAVWSPGFGIRCGSLVIQNPQGQGGPVTCGSMSVEGAFSAGNLSSPGYVQAGTVYYLGGVQVINSGAAFTGYGVEVGAFGIGCGYLAVRSNFVDCQEIRCGSGWSNFGGSGIVYCVQAYASQWIMCNGWSLTSADHSVWCSQLFANYWSGGLPVITTDGVFRGPGIELYAHGGIGCGYIQLYGGLIDGVGNIYVSGSIIATYHQTWGHGVVINENGAFVGNGGVDVGGAAIGCMYLSTRGRGGYDQIDTGTLNCGGNISSNNAYANYFQSNGNIYAGGTYQGGYISIGGNCYVAGVYQGGQFQGGSVSTGPIWCNALTTQGGQIYGVSTLTATTVNLSNLQVNGTTLIANNNVWLGQVQTQSVCYASSFGVYGVVVGTTGTFNVLLVGGGSVTLRFNNGLHCT